MYIRVREMQTNLQEAHEFHDAPAEPLSVRLHQQEVILVDRQEPVVLPAMSKQLHALVQTKSIHYTFE